MESSSPEGPAAGPPAGPPPSRLGDVLQALNLAVSAVRLYPQPQDQPPFLRSMEILEATVSSGPIRVEVGPSHFLSFPAGNPGIDALSRALFSREVLHLAILEPPSTNELAHFGTMISKDPQELAATGGARRYLTDRDVTSIVVEMRDLVVTDQSEAEGQPPPEPEQMTSNLDLGGPAEDVYRRLELEHASALEAGQDRGVVEGRIADAVAAMSPDDRFQLLHLAFEKMPSELASAITGQLSDSELVDALVWISSSRGADVVLAYAAQVVLNSGGRRKELPGMLSGQLETHEATPSEVMNRAGVRRLLGEEASEQMHGGVDMDGSDLKAEADAFMLSSAQSLTLSLVQGLIEASVDEDGLGEVAELAIGTWTQEGAFEPIVDLIDIFLRRPEDLLFAKERALDAAVSERVISAAFDGSSVAARKIVELGGTRAIPLLIHQLAIEPQRHRRKALMDAITTLAAIDHRLALGSLEDHRWFLVRNMVTVLAKAAPDRAAGPISKLIVHPDARVRREVVRALSISGGDQYLKTVLRSLGDHDDSVRLAGIAALGSINTTSSITALKEVSESRTRSPRERKEALTSLAMASNPSARAVLEQAARRRWPPSAITRDLASHASGLLNRSSNPA